MEVMTLIGLSSEISLVTGSLLFVAPINHGIVLRLTRVSADLWAVDGVSRTAFGDRLVLIMATGNGRPEANRPVEFWSPLEFSGSGCDPWLSRTL